MFLLIKKTKYKVSQQIVAKFVAKLTETECRAQRSLQKNEKETLKRFLIKKKLSFAMRHCETYHFEVSDP